MGENFSPPGPERPQVETPEQLKEAQEKHEAACTARFIGEYVAGTGNLPPEQEAFLVDYLKSHHGLWEKFDDEDVYLYKTVKDGNTLHFHFCQIVEGQPYSQEEAIKLPG